MRKAKKQSSAESTYNDYGNYDSYTGLLESHMRSLENARKEEKRAREEYLAPLIEIRDCTPAVLREYFTAVLVELRRMVRNLESLSTEDQEKHRTIIAKVISIQATALEIPRRRASMDQLETLRVAITKTLPDAYRSYRDYYLQTGSTVTASKNSVSDNQSFTLVYRQITKIRDDIIFQSLNGKVDPAAVTVYEDAKLSPYKTWKGFESSKQVFEALEVTWEKAKKGQHSYDDATFINQVCEYYVPAAACLLQEFENASQAAKDAAALSFNNQLSLIQIRLESIIEEQEKSLLLQMELQQKALEQKIADDADEARRREEVKQAEEAALKREIELKKEQIIELENVVYLDDDKSHYSHKEVLISEQQTELEMYRQMIQNLNSELARLKMQRSIHQNEINELQYRNMSIASANSKASIHARDKKEHWNNKNRYWDDDCIIEDLEEEPW